MKRTVAGFIAGVVFAGGAAFAAAPRVLMMRAGDDAIYAPAASGCHADRTGTVTALECFRVDGHGYGLLYNAYLVEVISPGAHGKVVFKRVQPQK